MRLSEAIRLGAMLRPQQYGFLLKDGRTCALGAAMDAIDMLPARDEVLILTQAEYAPWPWTWTSADSPWSSCPACCEFHSTVGGVIGHLNDQHQWSREQIADWVQTIEEQQAVESERQRADESASSVYAVAGTLNQPRADTSRIGIFL